MVFFISGVHLKGTRGPLLKIVNTAAQQGVVLKQKLQF